MNVSKINATSFQIYSPTEYYNNWELHFYDEQKKRFIKVTIEDITKFKEELTIKTKQLR